MRFLYPGTDNGDSRFPTGVKAPAHSALYSRPSYGSGRLRRIYETAMLTTLGIAFHGTGRRCPLQ